MATKEEIKQGIRDDLNQDPDDPTVTISGRTWVGYNLNSPLQKITPLVDSIVDRMVGSIDSKETINSFYDPSSGIPITPALFDRYVASTSGNGWIFRSIYEWDGMQWIRTIPSEGYEVWVKDVDKYFFFNGTNWIERLASGGITDHRLLDYLNSTDYYHMSYAQVADLVDGGDSSLHYHLADRNRANHSGTQTASTISDFSSALIAVGDLRYSFAGHDHDSWYYTESESDLRFATAGHNHDHALLLNPNSTNYYHLTLTQYTDLTDGGDSSLHYHSADRAAVFGGLVQNYIPVYNSGNAFANSYLNQANSQLVSSENINLGNQNDPNTTQPDNWITWGYRTDNSPYYAIRTDRHAYVTGGGNNRLQIGWHTGVEIGASSTYGGTRFFNNSPFLGAQIMSIGDGDNHVRIMNRLIVSNDIQSNVGIYSYNPADHGSYIGMFKDSTALPGSTGAYPTLKTDFTLIYFGANSKYVGDWGNSSNQTSLRITKNDISGYGVILNADGTSYLNGGNVGILTDNPQYNLHVNGSFYATSMSRAGYTVWDSGNDGPGSGLDADALDTYHYDNFIGKNGNPHYQANGWIQFAGAEGLYFPNSSSGTHFNPNNYNTYASFLLEGLRGGYQGFYFHDCINGLTLMYRGSDGLGGMYYQTTSTWQWYFDPSINNIRINGVSPVWHTGNLTGARNEHTHTNISNSDMVDGVHATGFFNNMGNTHTAFHSFDALPAHGPYFLQGSTNGPIAGQNDYYGLTIGLGSDYGYESYASQLYWKRGSASLLYMRFREGGTWGNWYKVGAGYADDATHAYNADQAANSNALMGIGVGNLTANYLVKFNSAQFVNSSIYDTGDFVNIYSTNFAIMAAGPNIGISCDATEGGISIIGDVISDLSMAPGTHAVIRNAKIDFGAENIVTGSYNTVTTVNLAAYTSSSFLISVSTGLVKFRFIGCKKGTPIFVSNINGGSQAYLRGYSENDDNNIAIDPRQTVMMYCINTDESTYWIWHMCPFMTLGV